MHLSHAGDSDAQCFEMGAVAVGATIYFGNDSSRDEIAYVSDMFEEAHALGMVTVLWCYTRNNAFKSGGSMALNDSLDRLLDNIAEIKPTILVAVPRIFNRIYAAVNEDISHRPAFLQRIIHAGLRGAIRRANGERLTALERAALAFDDKAVFGKIRQRFGGRLKWVISGSATLGRDVAQFIDAVGLAVYEGYGLTEAVTGIMATPLNQYREGSVGIPFPDMLAKIITAGTTDEAPLGEEGEICLNGPADKLNSTVVSQPAIFVGSLAALEVLKTTEPAALTDCVATAGLSLGEYTALVFAGALNFRDGLRVVQKRGEAMQAAADATPSGMVSVIGLERPQVEELVAAANTEGFVQIANLLCPANIVVSGDKAGCAALQRIAEEKGARTVALAVAGAFHTPIMKPADEKLAAALDVAPSVVERGLHELDASLAARGLRLQRQAGRFQLTTAPQLADLGAHLGREPLVEQVDQDGQEEVGVGAADLHAEEEPGRGHDDGVCHGGHVGRYRHGSWRVVVAFCLPGLAHGLRARVLRLAGTHGQVHPATRDDGRGEGGRRRLAVQEGDAVPLGGLARRRGDRSRGRRPTPSPRRADSPPARQPGGAPGTARERLTTPPTSGRAKSLP